MAGPDTVVVLDHGNAVVVGIGFPAVHAGILDIPVRLGSLFSPFLGVRRLDVKTVQAGASAVAAIVADGAVGARLNPVLQGKGQAVGTQDIHSRKGRDLHGLGEIQQPVEHVKIVASLMDPQGARILFATVPSRHVGSATIVEFTILDDEHLSEFPRGYDALQCF